MLGQNKASVQKYIKLLSAINKNGGVECEQLPHIFFPEDSFGFNEMYYKEKKLAIEICNRCPVQKLCADYALTEGERHGIWGGTVPSDR